MLAKTTKQNKTKTYMTHSRSWDVEIMTTIGWKCHIRAAPSCDIFNLWSSYFHVPHTTVRHLLTVHRGMKLKNLDRELLWTSHVDINSCDIIFTEHRPHTSQKLSCEQKWPLTSEKRQTILIIYSFFITKSHINVTLSQLNDNNAH